MECLPRFTPLATWWVNISVNYIEVVFFLESSFIGVIMFALSLSGTCVLTENFSVCLTKLEYIQVGSIMYIV